MKFSRYISVTRVYAQLFLLYKRRSSNRVSFAHEVFLRISLINFQAGNHLLSHTVSSAVPSAAYVLTIVFGMGTGVSRKRIATGKYLAFSFEVLRNQAPLVCYRGHSPYTHSVHCLSSK